ncbi:MAG: hypothetical protein H7296_04070 [Bacteroidia bacterium]|nr:hypothetical protein [Bacteroidia bacterium]
MKIFVKYIWTIIFIPAFIILTADVLNISPNYAKNVNSAKEFYNIIHKIITPSSLATLEIKIKAVSKDPNFSAEGMLVQLFDENYNVIDKSQVMEGKVRFELKSKYLLSQHFRVVAPGTADEINVDNLVDLNMLTIHESQLTELDIH